MEIFLLSVIAIMLFLDLQEHRDIRGRAEDALRQVHQAERRINRLTDEGILTMVEEVRKATAPDLE